MEKKKNKFSNPVISTLTGIRAQFVKEPPAGVLKETDRLDGKTVLIDGASSGLGFAIATEVARRGAKIIMACRSGIPEKGEMVRKLSGNDDVHMLPVDFSDFASIRKLADDLTHATRGGGLDIYISDAAIVPARSRQTKEGLEEMFMVNYLSKFYFINLLVKRGLLRMQDAGCRMQDGDPGPALPRIIVVSSESHRNPEAIDWEGFGKYKEYTMGKTVELYGYYKLLLTTFVAELSRRLNPGGKTNVSVFSLCPGPVNTNIAREAPALFRPLMRLVFSLFFKSPGKAALPVIWLAASKDQEGKPFDYLFKMTRKEIDGKAADPENGKRLWERSEETLKELKIEN